MIRRVPISCREYWQVLLLELCNVAIEDRNDFVAMRHGERSARQEVILDVDNN